MVGIERIKARNFDRESPNLIKGTWLLVIRGREVRNREALGFSVSIPLSKAKELGKKNIYQKMMIRYF